MKLFGLVVLVLVGSVSVCAQSNEYLKSLQGIYSYGDYYPVYLKNSDGTVDSSISYCSYGQLEVYYFEGKVKVNMEVCGATYHIGSISGTLSFKNEKEAELKFDTEEGDMGCHLNFAFASNEITVEEIECSAYHGARAGFSGTFKYVRSTGYQDANEAEQIKTQVVEFFDDFNQGNFDSLDGYCLNPSDFILITILQNDNDQPLHIDHMKELKRTLSEIEGRYKEEIIGDIQVLVHDHMAVAWMRYNFIRDGSIYHCGVNKFDFIKYHGEWKISALEEDFFATGCSENMGFGDYEYSETESIFQSQVNSAMNKWHMAASDADQNKFFGFMDESCIYLGTDPSERWTKESFIEFAKPYFDKGKAWSFNTNWRNVYFDESYEMAWFEESLDTHMGECRGSGVLVRTDNGWKLKHYNLSVTIANDKMGEFKKLAGK